MMKCVFLDELKHTDIQSIYEKESRNEKLIYRSLFYRKL